MSPSSNGVRNASSALRLISAHRGVLFLDECAEISLSALEALR
ncbi:hypothetical protein FRD82_08085, partial [Mycobacterium tuberculosis]